MAPGEQGAADRVSESYLDWRNKNLKIYELSFQMISTRGNWLRFFYCSRQARTGGVYPPGPHGVLRVACGVWVYMWGLLPHTLWDPLCSVWGWGLLTWTMSGP